MTNVKNILFPTDCSEITKEALQYAIEFTKRFDAKLTIFNVIGELCIYGNNSDYLSPANYQKMVDESEKEALKILEDYWESSKDTNVNVELKQVKGDAFKEIIDFVKSANMDMIIMGTHGRTGIQHIMMGSVAEKVVRYSPVPVLTVKNKDLQFPPT